MRTRQFTFGREFRQDTTSLRDPGTRKKTKQMQSRVSWKVGGLTHAHFPFDQGSNAVQSLELKFLFNSHFDLFVYILPFSFLSGKCQMPRARHCDRWSRPGGQRRILSTRLSRSGGSCRRHAERTEIQLKMLLTSQPTLSLPLCVLVHTHNSFLSSRLSFASSLAFLFAKQTENVGRKREKSLVNDGERGDDLPRAKRADTHTRARAPFRIVKPTPPPPPFPPILLHQSILFLIPVSAVFCFVQPTSVRS